MVSHGISANKRTARYSLIVKMVTPPKMATATDLQQALRYAAGVDDPGAVFFREAAVRVIRAARGASLTSVTGYADPEVVAMRSRVFGLLNCGAL